MLRPTSGPLRPVLSLTTPDPSECSLGDGRWGSLFPDRMWKLAGTLGPEGASPQVPTVQNLLRERREECLGEIFCFGFLGRHGALAFLPLGLGGAPVASFLAEPLSGCDGVPGAAILTGNPGSQRRCLCIYVAGPVVARQGKELNLVAGTHGSQRVGTGPGGVVRALRN